MNTITIKIQDCYAKSEVFTVSEFSHSIQHYYDSIKKIKKLDEKSITKDGYDKIFNAFMNVNFNEVFNENPKVVDDYKNGKNVNGFIMGLIMKKTSGKVNPGVTNIVLKEELDRL